MRSLFRGKIVVGTLALVGLLLPGAADAQVSGFTVSTQPAVYPAFDPSITDYVVRCAAGTPVDVSVSAQAGTGVGVDGQGATSGDFSTPVSLTPGQGFRIVASDGAESATYFVRCLPSDFPTWTFQRSGQPQADLYAVAPFARTNFQPPPPTVSPNYVALFDTDGVPVWWMKAAQQALDFHPLDDGDVIWARFNATGAEEHRLDGSLVRTVAAASPATDPHEVLRLANGNYIVASQRTLTGFSVCGETNVAITDDGVQEVTPDGALVWSWWASDHIPLSEVPDAWCSTIVNATPRDVTHINSIEPTGDGFVISFRHLDAIYKVSTSDGAIEWKLGGVTRPESLSFVDDPIGGFAGQHDARILSDGTLSLHDNGFHAASSRAPRAVRYTIDTTAKTATLVEQKNDPDPIATPLCCGSARRLPGGDWVMSWGSAGLVTELDSSGARVASLKFGDDLFSYRAHPILPGALSHTALRDGMDAQYPRGFVRPRGTSKVRIPLIPAFAQCTAPNSTHGAPLDFDSCSPPAAASSFLTVGTTDANGALARSSGSVVYKVIVGDSSTPANEADVSMTFDLSDVRRKVGLVDYAGELQVRDAVRITDRLNGPLKNEPATLEAQFPVTVPCAVTVALGTGATCSLSSTFNAIVPGVVVEGKRANWELGQLQVFDGGSTGTAGASDSTLFETQGIFVP
jgi:Arylsulfotransferase (ASST)